LIRHGPHWKRRVQQFFYCCVCVFVTPVTFLPSRCLATLGAIFTEPSRYLATIGGNTYTHTDSNVIS
jgi:hypothetical protein